MNDPDLISGDAQETAWFRLVADGNELAFRRLFDRYNKLLYTFAEGILQSSADAEEVVQDSFTRLWVNRASLPDIENPGSYLYKIVRNRCIDQIRQLARERRLVERFRMRAVTIDDGLQDELRKQEYQQLIDQALAELSPQKQTVFRLSREQEYSHEKIADLTGLSRSRVNHILVEVLKHLKNRLEKHSLDLALVFWLTAWERLF